MKKILLATCFLISVFVNAASATENTRPLSTDSRIKTVAYQQNNVVPIYGNTFITTQIILGSNEKIIDIQGGDADAWTVNVSKMIPNVLNIKPTVLGSNTDIIVSSMDDTGKVRRYFFHLKSNKVLDISSQSNNLNQTYAVQFVYPNEERQKLLSELNYESLQKKAILNASQNPKNYNWDYSFNGSKSIMPLHVFDDGKFTYLQLRDNQDIPAVFAVNNAKGAESVVNFRQVGNYLVIEQVAPQLTLRDGKYQVASLFNNPLISKINRN